MRYVLSFAGAYIRGAGWTLGIISALWGTVYVDPFSHKNESTAGMSVYVDHATGCQYLAGLFSRLPRMNAEGKQVCNQGG